MLRIFVSILFLFLIQQGFSQEKDSVINVDDKLGLIPKDDKEKTSLFRDTSKLQSARSAVYRSAIIPGWGQVRNGKWWKVPLIYGGFVGLGLVYEFNQRYYKEFLDESQYRKSRQPTDPVSKYPQYAFVENDQQIYSAKDFYRRNRDLTIIGFVAFYGINMIDAYIDARLATFNVDDDLSLKIRPSIHVPVYAGAYQSPIPMLKLTIKL